VGLDGGDDENSKFGRQISAGELSRTFARRPKRDWLGIFASMSMVLLVVLGVVFAFRHRNRLADNKVAKALLDFLGGGSNGSASRESRDSRDDEARTQLLEVCLHLFGFVLNRFV
jgi:hypothetical protein